MLPISRSPLLRLLPPLVTGITAAWFFPHLLPPGVVLLLALTLLTLLFLSYRLPFRLEGGHSLLVAFVLLTTAYAYTIFRSPALQPAHITNVTGAVDAVLLHLSDAPVEKEKTLKIPATIIAVKQKNSWKNCEGKVLVYIAKDNTAKQLRYGDELLVNATPEKIPGPMNPGEFDYRRFLALHGIHARLYVPSGKWISVKTGQGNPLKAAAIGLQRKLAQTFAQSGLCGQELAVAEALLLGETDALDPGLIKSYAVSGALHVLSVSGMHVAIVYVVINALLAVLDKNKKLRWLKMALLLAFLWFYALLTGLSPSVMRSAAMLSFVIVGRSLKHPPGIWNTLAASLFFLLLIDPLMLFDVGFQLSYLAVGAIVALHPRLYACRTPQHWIMKQVWTMISVSLVAQLLTFPISLYYFRQFPTYFLPANLVVIPLSTLVIYGGMLLLAVSAIPVLAQGVGWCYIKVLEMLNGAVQLVECLPGATLESPTLGSTQLLLLYMVVVLFVFFLLRKKIRWLQASLVSLSFLLCSFIADKRETGQHRRIIVYSLPKCSAIDCIFGSENFLIADSNFLQDHGALDFHVGPGWQENGVLQHYIASLQDSAAETAYAHYRRNGLCCFGKTILILGRREEAGWPEGVKADMVLLTQNTKASIDSIAKQLHPTIIIADGSDGAQRIAGWAADCKRLKIEFHNVKEEGAFILEE